MIKTARRIAIPLAIFLYTPPPLEPSIESELLLNLETGNKEARGTLIIHNLRLVSRIAHKLKSTEIDINDLISIGSIGLIKGIDTFKMDKKVRLSTYISKCITNEIFMHFRKLKKLKLR